VTFREDLHQARTGTGPAVLATLSNTAIGYHGTNGDTNITRDNVVQKRSRTVEGLVGRANVMAAGGGDRCAWSVLPFRVDWACGRSGARRGARPPACNERHAGHHEADERQTGDTDNPSWGAHRGSVVRAAGISTNVAHRACPCAHAARSRGGDFDAALGAQIDHLFICPQRT
jgi:hypothetical protein